MKWVWVLVPLMLSGCAVSSRHTYGKEGPGMQADVYHPLEDPLFRD